MPPGVILNCKFIDNIWVLGAIIEGGEIHVSGGEVLTKKTAHKVSDLQLSL